MEKIGNGPGVKWPLHDDVHWYPKTDVLCRCYDILLPLVCFSDRKQRIRYFYNWI